ALAITELMRKRGKEPKPNYGRAHLFHSLKHPDEVRLLREVYQQGFFLIGVSSSKAKRLDFLTREKGIPMPEAEELIRRDESEEDKHGQHTRETFHLADAFLNMDSDSWKTDLDRIFNLL